MIEDTSPTGRNARLYPSWWRRNMTPGALWSIGAILFTATVVVTTFIVTVSHDSTSLATVITLAQGMKEDVGQIKKDVGELKRWKDDTDAENRRIAQEALKRNPYTRPAPKRKAP